MKKKLLIVGEAYGEEEEKQNLPFVGASGKFLRSQLRFAGIDQRDCYFTNVVNQRPRPTLDFTNFCGPKAGAVPGLPALAPGKYLRAEYADEVARLQTEIENTSPNLILALGNVPASIITRVATKISRARGTVSLHEGRKILPTYHPAAILREYSLRPIFLKDLAKARREMERPELYLPNRQLWIAPDLEDIARFITNHIIPQRHLPWGVDIETKGGTITEIGFARPEIGLVIPFYSRAQPDGNYWRSHADERSAWAFVRAILEKHLEQPVHQNGLYDIGYCLRTMRIKMRGAGDDTMLLHHSLQPELKKGLGFLASIYTNEGEWKFMRQTDTLKKEDVE